MVVIVSFLADNDHGYQVYCGCAVLNLACVLQMLCCPYTNTTKNTLELLSLGAGSISLYIGLAIGLDGLSTSQIYILRLAVGLLNLVMILVFVRYFLHEVTLHRDWKFQVAKKQTHLKTAEESISYGPGGAMYPAASSNFDRDSFINPVFGKKDTHSKTMKQDL